MKGMKAVGSLVTFALLSTSSALASGALSARQSKYGGGEGYHTPTTEALTGNGTVPRGDTKCSPSMCVAAEVNDNTVQYTLTSRRGEVGWMGIGFGSQMTRSPMVIMWTNEDGSLTLSQRQANSYAEPTVVPSPPRVASMEASLSVTSGEDQKYVFTIPANTDKNQNIVWALGGRRPASSAMDAPLSQHVDQGRFTLDLTRSLNGGDDDSGEHRPFSSTERVILAHAVVATVGFLVVLPIGALIPRYLRTFVGGWFQFHWIIQFILGGLACITGIILGFAAVSNRDGVHFGTSHKRGGVTLLIFYVVQVALGAIIHFIKPKSWTSTGRRPAQNYIHAILGLLTVGLALAQVRNGYKTEWPAVTGRIAAKGVEILWYVWVVLIPVLYFAGLALLPRQFKQEKKAKQPRSPDLDHEDFEMMRQAH